MRPDQGVNLVSGALKASLARAQKNYKFHGAKSAYNAQDKQESRKKKQLKADWSQRFEVFGKYAISSIQQLREFGYGLEFVDGGYVKPGITEEDKEKYTVLKRRKKGTPHILRIVKSTDIDDLEAFSREVKKRKASESKQKRGQEIAKPKVAVPKLLKEPQAVVLRRTEGIQAKVEVDNRTKDILKLLKDKTIGKSKRKRLLRKLRKFKHLKNLSATAAELPKLVEESGNVLKDSRKRKLSQASKLIGGSTSSVQSSSPDRKQSRGKKGMGPELGRTVQGPTQSSSHSSSSSPSIHQLPQPKKILYMKDKLVLGWRQKRGPGVGFHNFGNTCYLNSSLQALFHIPAFVNWLQADEEHKLLCCGTAQSASCIICAVATTLNDHSKSSSAIRPRVLDKLKAVCKHFSYGRQEDAHEFLRYLLEGMERSYLTAINGLRFDNRTKETNPLGQIFGGYIRTEVTCLKCNCVSTTFQPSAELQLDIRHVTTLEDALQQHFRKERLDNNDYRCEKCRTISQATKQFSLEVPPLVLCLQLKRFTLYGTKISKRVHCNRLLNMSKFMHKSKKESASGDQDLKYRLVALVTHMGQSPNCGHYTAIAESSGGMFYQFDDQFVYQVSPQTAQNNDAYVIIYEMDKNCRNVASEASYTLPNTAYSHSNLAKVTPSGTSTKTLLPSTSAKRFVIPFAKSNNGEATLARSQPTNTTEKPSTAVSCPKTNGSVTGVHLNIDRKLVSFGLNKSGSVVVPMNGVGPTNKINILKPGIALTNSSTKVICPTANPVVTTKSSSLQLVPYNDIENDDSDTEEKELLPIKNKIPKSLDPASPIKIMKPSSENLPLTPPSTPKKNVIAPLPALASVGSIKSPEGQYGIKRKLNELLGPGSNKKLPSDESVQAPTATSKWTVIPNPNKVKSGNSSDPESKSKKLQKSAAFSRSKSVERTLSSPLKFLSPLVPPISKKKRVEESNLVENTEAPGEKQPLIANGIPLTNGHASTYVSKKLKKRKRSRSSSSSSTMSSSSDDKRKRKKKHLKKKKKAIKERRSKSSDSEISSSDVRIAKERKHKHSKKKRERSPELEKSSSQSRSVSRDTDSEERDRRRRRDRNPSPKTPVGVNNLNGHASNYISKKLKKRKRFRSSSSSSTLTSSSDEEIKRKKKHLKKKKKAIKERRSKSSDSEISSSDVRIGKERKHKHSKKKQERSPELEKSNSQSRSVRRETGSEESDRIRRDRNPIPKTFVGNNLIGHKEKFDPNKISDRDKSILDWNGQPSLLSKTIQEDRRKMHQKTEEELIDEDLDKGRTKKIRKSETTNGNYEDGVNKFQLFHDRKHATSFHVRGRMEVE